MGNRRTGSRRRLICNCKPEALGRSQTDSEHASVPSESLSASSTSDSSSGCHHWPGSLQAGHPTVRVARRFPGPDPRPPGPASNDSESTRLSESAPPRRRGRSYSASAFKVRVPARPGSRAPRPGGFESDSGSHELSLNRPIHDLDWDGVVRVPESHWQAPWDGRPAAEGLRRSGPGKSH